MAEAQSRRLEEQRATFHAPQKLPSLGRVPPRPLEDREQLYSTILSHQVSHPTACPPRRQGPGFLVSWSLFSLGPHPSFSPGTCPSPPSPSHMSYMPLTPAWLLSRPAPLRTLPTTFPASPPPVPADGSPAVRASPTPRGAGAPGVAAESSGWRSNGGAKVPAPHTHLLRLELPPALLHSRGSKLGGPLQALSPVPQGHQRLEEPAEFSIFTALIHLSWELEGVKVLKPWELSR